MHIFANHKNILPDIRNDRLIYSTIPWNGDYVFTETRRLYILVFYTVKSLFIVLLTFNACNNNVIVYGDYIISIT